MFIMGEVEKFYQITKSSDNDAGLNDILETKLNIMNENFKTLRPATRFRRWNSLGSAIKWAAGNPDADDLAEINEKLNLLTKENNLQININDELNVKMRETAKAISELCKSNELTSNSLKQVELIFNVDLTIKKLESINNAIMLAKKGIACKEILSQNELEIINEKFPSSSLIQSLTIAKPTVAYSSERILYEMEIPLLDEHEFDLLHLEAIPRENEEIELEYKEVLIRDNITYGIKNECQKVQNNYICFANQIIEISESECIPKIVRLKDDAKCIMLYVNDRESVNLIDNGVLAIKNLKPTTLFNSCGIGNHSVVGSAIILFEGCYVEINKKKFQSVKIETKFKTEILPIMNSKIEKKNNRPVIKLHELSDLHAQNRDYIRSSIMYTSGSATILLTMIAILAIYIFRKLRRSVMSSLGGEELCDNPKQQQQSHNNNSNNNNVNTNNADRQECANVALTTIPFGSVFTH